MRPVSSLVSRMSALPSGDSAMPASTHCVPASASSAAVSRFICTRMRRTRASFNCSSVIVAAAGSLSRTRHHDAHAAAHAAAVLRVFPRLGAAQHHGALDRRTADHAAHHHLFEAMHLVGPRERDHDRAFHVASAHRAAERSFSGQGLEAGDLVFAAERLARAGNDAGHAILPAVRSRRRSRCHRTERTTPPSRWPPLKSNVAFELLSESLPEPPCCSVGTSVQSILRADAQRRR